MIRWRNWIGWWRDIAGDGDVGVIGSRLGRIGDGMGGIMSGSGEAVGAGAVLELNMLDTMEGSLPKFSRTLVMGALNVDTKWPIIAV